MDRKIDLFFEDYEEIAHDVTMSRAVDFSRNLAIWFNCLENSPLAISREVERLKALQPWEEVEKNVIIPPRSMVGSGRLDWPVNRDQRLGGQLVLLEQLATGDLEPTDFAFNFFYSGDTNINSTVGEMANVLFEPHSRELKRYLLRAIDEAEAAFEYVPAADRLVSLDHNSPQYKEAIDAVSTVQEKLRENNEIDPEDKIRVEVEIRSGLDILAAPKTRIEAAKTLLLGALGWLAMEFASSAVGVVADNAIKAVSALLGA
ncbi:MAG: hypothetical protein NXI27_31065 [Alphaproteobacteria bacterium]|nr:hypothetical protein [Alphaproteobacteria bacterium]